MDAYITLALLFYVSFADQHKLFLGKNWMVQGMCLTNPEVQMSNIASSTSEGMDSWKFTLNVLIHNENAQLAFDL